MSPRSFRFLPWLCLALATLDSVPRAAAQEPLASPAASASASAPAPAASASPAQSRSVYLDAKASTGGSGTTTYRGYYGTFNRSEVKSMTLEIQLRNMAHTPGTFDLDWIFFGRNGSRRFIYDIGTEKVELAAGGFKVTVAVSDELQSSRYRGYYGYNYRSGDRPDGWLVRVKIGDEILRTKASSPQIEALGQSKASLERMLKEFQSSPRATN